MNDVQRYTVTALDGGCRSRIDARSFSDAVEFWAEFWLDVPDSSDVHAALGEQSKIFNVVRDTHGTLHQVIVKEITT